MEACSLILSTLIWMQWDFLYFDLNAMRFSLFWFEYISERHISERLNDFLLEKNF
jgi:hypothetical protein